MGKYPNIKLGTGTYDDISTISVERVEGGTAEYVYNVPQITTPIVSMGIVRRVAGDISLTEDFKMTTSIRLKE